MKHSIPIISIGPLCLGAQSIADIGMRTASFPFDWIFSDLRMVQNCIETRFSIFLDRNLISRGDKSGVSTHTHYSKNGPSPTFNHHDLTLDETHAAFTRRADRFMNAYNDTNGTILMYMTKADELESSQDKDYVIPFSTFVSATSPKSTIVFVVLSRTNTYDFSIEWLAENCLVARVEYGDLDNLKAIASIIDLVRRDRYEYT